MYVCPEKHKTRRYDVGTGNLAGSSQVQFGPDENGQLPTTSEQSVAVDGCRAFVVQNYMGVDRLEDDIVCSSARQVCMYVDLNLYRLSSDESMLCLLTITHTHNTG